MISLHLTGYTMISRALPILLSQLVILGCASTRAQAPQGQKVDTHISAIKCIGASKQALVDMLGEVVPQPVNVGPELHFKPAGFHEVIANGSGRKMTSIAFTFDNEKTWKEALPLVGISPNGATGKALPNDPHQVSISGLKGLPLAAIDEHHKMSWGAYIRVDAYPDGKQRSTLMFFYPGM